MSSDSNKSKLALIEVDQHLLAEALMLPGETVIEGITMDAATHIIYLVVSSPDLPEVEKGHRPPIANPFITTTFDWGLNGKPEPEQL